MTALFKNRLSNFAKITCFRLTRRVFAEIESCFFEERKKMDKKSKISLTKCPYFIIPNFVWIGLFIISLQAFKYGLFLAVRSSPERPFWGGVVYLGKNYKTWKKKFYSKIIHPEVLNLQIWERFSDPHSPRLHGFLRQSLLISPKVYYVWSK